ncbi:hypothetical protein LOK74_10865 [Brevibacillus humidisoli]|uniref:hypothetical protein n=1 Tax=Brevibacillus humidisoli TaxID=2895522 RepID=UPI001E57665A|nr:hypothetical protein [Brevibacillus humidisoli]UFJ42954.1 hypothetical protein LOK74_10865 [Brevibacillus humidisoli]
MIDLFYTQLTAALANRDGIDRIDWREFAGHRFLYVTSSLAHRELITVILQDAEALVKGTRIRCQCNHIRTEEQRSVFRFRFLVPEEKMFCCGNQCEDCTLHRQQ